MSQCTTKDISTFGATHSFLITISPRMFVGIWKLGGSCRLQHKNNKMTKNDIWHAYLTICKWSHHPLCAPRTVLSTFVLCITLWDTETGAKKGELRGPRAEEEPLYKQFITLLWPVSPLPPYVFLPLFPLLSSCSPLFLSVPTKKKTPKKPPPLQTPHLSLPPHPSAVVSRSLPNPGGESVGSVMAYGYLTSASPLIRLSSLNDATCGATNATEKSIKAFH